MVIKRNATLALAAVMGLTILAAPASTMAYSKDWKNNKKVNKCTRLDRRQARIFDGFEYQLITFIIETFKYK